MSQGKPICEDVQWIIIHFSAEHSSEDISMYTNVSKHKVKAILACHKRTGGVDIPKHLRPNLYQSFKMRTLGYVSGHFLYLFRYSKFYFTASQENNK